MDFASRDLRLVRPTGDAVYPHVRGDVLEGGAGEEAAVVVSVREGTEREHMREFCGAAGGGTPEEPFRTVTGYRDPMAEVVSGRRGAIDKVAGDGFMVVFGIPDGAGNGFAWGDSRRVRVRGRKVPVKVRPSCANRLNVLDGAREAAGWLGGRLWGPSVAGASRARPPPSGRGGSPGKPATRKTGV